MPLLSKNNKDVTSDKEVTELIFRIQNLINLEFKAQLNVTQDRVEELLYTHDFKSQSYELLEKTKQLTSVPLSQRPKNINNILELLASDQLKNPVQISAAGIFAFVIDKSSNKFWSASSLKCLNKLGQMDVNFIHIKPLSNEAMKDLEQNQRLFQASVDQDIPMKCLSLDGFFWFVSARFSQGQLLDKMTLLPQVRLTRWPEICRQSGYRAYARMAIQLMQHPASASEFIQAQGSPLKLKAIIFLNACYLCGWLIETQEPIKTKRNNAKQKRKLNFISRIKAKLGIEKV